METWIYSEEGTIRGKWMWAIKEEVIRTSVFVSFMCV